jgi:PAS domain S-box-containing protein
MKLYRNANQQILEEMQKKEEAQFALGTSEARYRSVFNSATDGFIVIDQNDTIIEANEAANSMHGSCANGLNGSDYKDLIAPDYKQLYDEFRRRLDRSGAVRLDSVHVTRTGETVDVEVRGTNFHFGEKPRTLVIVTDVSDRKHAMHRQTMLSRKVLMAQEEERSRVSRDLHDELGQILTALHLELDILKKELAELQAPASDTFANALAMVEKAADELRHVCRGLRPPMLDDLGLEPALLALVDEFRERTNIKIEFSYNIKDENTALPLEVALCIYRIVQESLNNINRHANATEVRISLDEQNYEWVVSVVDNGDGFDMNVIDQSKGCGIAGMKERASLVKGSVEIESEPKKGTRLRLRITRSESNKE